MQKREKKPQKWSRQIPTEKRSTSHIPRFNDQSKWHVSEMYRWRFMNPMCGWDVNMLLNKLQNAVKIRAHHLISWANYGCSMCSMWVWHLDKFNWNCMLKLSTDFFSSLSQVQHLTSTGKSIAALTISMEVFPPLQFSNRETLNEEGETHCSACWRVYHFTRTFLPEP